MNRDEIEKGKWCSQSGFLDSSGKCRSPDGCYCKSMADTLTQLEDAKAAQALNRVLHADLARVRSLLRRAHDAMSRREPDGISTAAWDQLVADMAKEIGNG